MTYQRCLPVYFVLCVGCLADGPQGPESVSVDDVVEPLAIIELEPGHTIELYDFGDGTRQVSENLPEGVDLSALPARPGSFVALFRQLNPGVEVPASLFESDRNQPQRALPEGVGLVEQAVSTEQWRTETGGCNAWSSPCSTS